MDPIIITKLLSVLMANPNMIADGVNKYYQPGAVNAVQMQESLADASMGVLQCYHKTGRFRGVDTLASNWDRQNQFGADQSEIIKIHFNGVSGSPYEMIVAVMKKENSVRTFVIDENTTIPYNKRCELEHWIAGEPPKLESTGSSQNVKQGWIGIAIQDLTPALAKSLKLSIFNGALVHEVFQNGSADIAGLRAGDVIVKADGQLIADAKNVSNLIAKSSPDQKILFKILRDEKFVEVEVLIGEKAKQEVVKE